MNLHILTIISSLLKAAIPCRIDSNLHGLFKKQSNRLMTTDGQGRQSLVYEDVLITSTSISDYGDCYLKYGQSYIFGLKRMGKPVCFRCLTPISLSSNVLQLAHQYEETCYDTERDAKMTCFDSSLVSVTDGVLLFRSGTEEPASCSPIDGRFDVAYRMNDAVLSCEANQGTTADNCDASSVISVHFRNCSFPDFDMSLRCIGSWSDQKSKQNYLIVQNEENGEYRCGITVEESNVKKVYFGNDSTCSSLSVKNAFDTYYFHSEAHAKPFTPCAFPEWMLGEFDTMTVSRNELQYLQYRVGAVPLISHCVQTFQDRVLVYSETKCGEPLGYHCLLFNARSQNLIEFKTTIPSDSSNSSVCLNETQWDTIPWTSSVVKNTTPYSCGVFGSFATKNTSDYCYDVNFDCEDGTRMRISVFNCDDGIPFDSRSYTCLASWKHEDRLIIYATRGGDDNECFVTQYENGEYHFVSTGDQCERDFDFENKKNIDYTRMVLYEKG
ncbi:unnamed protein product [Caenorhabditis bovis]|uniref:Uncharacterized protein n=1 Tax=Caenorhabditis bovis TaxID=2654633 RepID=A0A8S1EUS9_9PELO|nr:unnamed protein product [Caenorhabditis bovis]